MSKRDIDEINRIVKEEGLTCGQRQILHRLISKQNLSPEEIRELAREVKELFPNK